MLDEFLIVLDALDAQKHAAKEQGSDKEDGDELFLSRLRSPNRHGHGETAGDQQDGVDGHQLQVDTLAGLGEHLRVSRTVYGVGHEQTAEEDHFGGEKNPHAERRGFTLLLERLVLAEQFSGSMHS